MNAFSNALTVRLILSGTVLFFSKIKTLKILLSTAWIDKTVPLFSFHRGSLAGLLWWNIY